MVEYRFEAGAFAGRRIDARFRRSIEIVAESPDALTVDHFFHRGRFWRAVIPRHAVARIHGQRFNFSSGLLRNPVVNHAQARFVLDPEQPVRLYTRPDLEEAPKEPRDDASGEADATRHAHGDGRRVDLREPEGPPDATIHDFVYSVEVAGPRGVSWSLRHAFGDFVAAHRVLSTEAVIEERIVHGGYSVRQSPELRLTADQRSRGLELVLRRSHTAGMRQRYYLITRRLGAVNCTSSVFDVLDEVLAERYTRLQRFAARTFWRLPVNLRRYLRLRSAIPAGLSMPTLNEEFAALAAPPLSPRRPKAP